jgi:hypothetical protein
MNFLDKLFIVILGSFFAALCAFLFNRFNQRSIQKVAISNKVSDAYLSLLESYENNCIDYWAKDYERENYNEIRKQEAYIKVHIMSLRRFDDEFSKHIKFNASEAISRKDMLDELYENVTKGEFESKKRKSNKMMCCTVMRSVLRLRMNIISSTHK